MYRNYDKATKNSLMTSLYNACSYKLSTYCTKDKELKFFDYKMTLFEAIKFYSHTIYIKNTQLEQLEYDETFVYYLFNYSCLSHSILHQLLKLIDSLRKSVDEDGYIDTDAYYEIVETDGYQNTILEAFEELGIIIHEANFEDMMNHNMYFEGKIYGSMDEESIYYFADEIIITESCVDADSISTIEQSEEMGLDIVSQLEEYIDECKLSLNENCQDSVWFLAIPSSNSQTPFITEAISKTLHSNAGYGKEDHAYYNAAKKVSIIGLSGSTLYYDMLPETLNLIITIGLLNKGWRWIYEQNCI